jgi:RNA polymerase sigma-70 factor (ECF subfamily)
MGMGNRQRRFEALVNAYAEDLYRFAYWLCRERGRAEDLVQETFLRAWRGLASLREEKSAKHWLITILRREHARGFERYQPRFEDCELDELIGTDHIPADTLAVHQALADLSDEYREPLLLQVLGGYPCEEIAEMLGLSRGAVMTRLFRARQKLRAALMNGAVDPGRVECESLP